MYVTQCSTDEQRAQYLAATVLRHNVCVECGRSFALTSDETRKRCCRCNGRREIGRRGMAMIRRVLARSGGVVA